MSRDIIRILAVILWMTAAAYFVFLAGYETGKKERNDHYRAIDKTMHELGACDWAKAYLKKNEYCKVGP